MAEWYGPSMNEQVRRPPRPKYYPPTYWPEYTPPPKRDIHRPLDRNPTDDPGGFRKGGRVRKTKRYMLHKGEQVLNVRQARRWRRGSRRR